MLHTFLPLLFVLVNANYDEKLARDVLLPLSAGAYSAYPSVCLNNTLKNAQIQKEAIAKCGSGYTGGEMIPVCFGFVGVAHNDQAVFLVFRGTVNFLQLYNEISSTVAYPQVPSKIGGTINKYFNDVFQDLYKELRPTLATLITLFPSYKIWITGHSLGGALASVAAVELVAGEKLPAQKITMISFGQPRVGNAEFARNYAQRLPNAYRVINKADIITSIPPMALNYFHINTEIWYNKDMNKNAHYLRCAAESNVCSNSLLLPSRSPADHFFYFDINIGAFGLGGCRFRWLLG